MLEVENRTSEFQSQWLEGQGQVRSFFTNTVLIGGFFESGLTGLEGPDTGSQISANSHILGLNVTANLNPQFRFVSQVLTGLSYTFQNPHNNPALSPPKRQFHSLSIGATVAQGYIEYLHSPGFRVQAGLGYVPFGYALQQRELVLFRRRGGPQLTAASGSNSVGIAFPLWMGVHVLGAFPSGNQDWGYNLYSFSPFTNSGTLGAGSRLWWRPAHQFNLGISAQTGKEVDDPYLSYGTDLNLKQGRWGLTAEYARNEVSHQSTNETYYAEPFLTFHDDTFVVYLAADYLNNANYTSVKGDASVRDPYERWSKGGGVNWLPLPFVRLRLGYLQHDYQGNTATIQGQNRDYESYDLSASVAF